MQLKTLRPDDAASYLSLSKSTLAKMRVRGDGPRYIKAGKKSILYEITDLNAWIEARKVSSTSENNFQGKINE